VAVTVHDHIRAHVGPIRDNYRHAMARKGGALLQPSVGDYVGITLPPALQEPGITHLPARVLEVTTNGHVRVLTSSGALKEAVAQTQVRCAVIDSALPYLTQRRPACRAAERRRRGGARVVHAAQAQLADVVDRCCERALSQAARRQMFLQEQVLCRQVQLQVDWQMSRPVQVRLQQEMNARKYS
jgi:hypothetical protein